MQWRRRSESAAQEPCRLSADHPGSEAGLFNETGELVVPIGLDGIRAVMGFIPALTAAKEPGRTSTVRQRRRGSALAG